MRHALKFAGLLFAVLILTTASVDARSKRPASRCTDAPRTFSWDFLLPGPAPQPNGCSPPVYQYGRFVGQDPDPNIRLQLLRDPGSGYAPL